MNSLRPWVLQVLGLLFILGGCESPTQLSQLEERCMEPRAQVCTREYQPVCGLDGTGQWQEYGNGCTACADAQVLGYNRGQCSVAAQ